MATHLILCSHLRSISPLILYHIQDLVHHIAWKGWHAAWTSCKSTGSTSRKLYTRSCLDVRPHQHLVAILMMSLMQAMACM